MSALAQINQQESYPTGQIRVQIKVLPHGQGLPLPAYNTEHAAAFDLAAAVTDDFVLMPGAFSAIPSGVALAIPEGYEMQVRGRSGLAARQGISVTHGTGTIDADYRGEIMVLLINHGTEPLVIKRGMRIAQCVVTPVPRVVWQQVDELPDTVRGVGGLGSTGA